MYIKMIEINAAAPQMSEIAQLPADAPSGVYEINIADLTMLAECSIKLLPANGEWDTTLTILNNTNLPLYKDDNGLWQVMYPMAESESRSIDYNIPAGVIMPGLRCFAKHVQGEPTNLLKISNNSISDLSWWTAGQSITTICVYRIA